MILDNKSNTKLYKALGKNMCTALSIINDTDLINKSVGKYEIENSKVYYMVQEYNTKPIEDCFWEAHKKYIDIQYILSGSEIIAYSNISDLKITKEYDTIKDRLILDGEGQNLILKEGYYMILFPEDGHMPSIALTASSPVKKVVIKVPVED
jgi:YhcH/YjgK/YiaL family protein